jgi:hypothetical protein
VTGWGRIRKGCEDGWKEWIRRGIKRSWEEEQSIVAHNKEGK